LNLIQCQVDIVQAAVECVGQISDLLIPSNTRNPVVLVEGKGKVLVSQGCLFMLEIEFTPGPIELKAIRVLINGAGDLFYAQMEISMGKEEG
jgi:hypothetical protein